MSSFPIPGTYASEASDIARDEKKRKMSPPSFFCAQTKGVVLAAEYFVDHRLAVKAHSAVAGKHRHRIQGALFGQLMASFEYRLKDFVAQVIDATDVLDITVDRQDWIAVDRSRILAQRDVAARIGAILIHPLLGWQEPREVNNRYKALFGQDLFVSADEIETVNRLWILRHTVAHNAGYLTHHDSYRLRARGLREQTIKTDAAYLWETREFLLVIVRRLGDPIGKGVLTRWLTQRSTGRYSEDSEIYARLKAIGTVIESRTKDLPTFTESDYKADRKAAGLP